MTLWDKLERAADDAPAITDLFEADGARAARFSARAGAFLFDYSKTAIDDGTRALLLRLAEEAGVAERRAAMFAGERINETEGRAVLHTALRAGEGPIGVDGHDVLPEIRATRERMAAFARDVRDGRFRAAGGAVTDVVNIGIGGSDLGPAMACAAFADIADGPRAHFLSNVDGAHAGEIMRACPPETTLVVIASKTFTTIETMTNAATLRDWMAASVPEPAAQMVAVSSAAGRAAEWGIPEDRVFGFGDYVGGRYSMWGPIGLPIMLAIGPERFGEFLAGAAAMDAHFRDAPLADNLPVLLALTGIWHRQVRGHATRAVLPYDQRLARLPAYLQQLEMESNGKRVTMAGEALPGPSGPVVWGEPGTNGQHAFFQLIHQGTDVIPCEFLVAAKGAGPALDHHHRLLLANCLAQSRALMVGRDMATARGMMQAAGFEGAELARQAAHRVFPGNRPSVTLIYPALTPATLGGIIALYEHRVFVEGVILNINSFDQWGVELGKELAKSLEPVLAGGEEAGLDGSTRQLVAFARQA